MIKHVKDGHVLDGVRDASGDDSASLSSIKRGRNESFVTESGNVDVKYRHGSLEEIVKGPLPIVEFGKYSSL